MRNGLPNSTVRRKLRHRICRCVLFLWLLPAFAEEHILILSSDMSIDKYMKAQEAFKKSINMPVAEVDLGQKNADEILLKSAIASASPALIYCLGSRAYQMAYRFSADSNIVVSSAINWKRLPLGTNTYGIASELHTGMELTMFRYFFPGIKKIGVLFSRKYNSEWIRLAIADGQDIGIEIIGKPVRGPGSVKRALKKLLPKVDALWLTSDPVVLSGTENAKTIFSMSDDMKKPIFAYDSAFMEYGAVMVISADIPTIGRQAANLAREVLENQATIEEKFQVPAGSEIIVNLGKIERYELSYDKDALGSVNKIIQ